MVSNASNTIPILDGSNFNNWKFRIISILRRDQCEDVIDQEVPEDMTKKKSFLLRDAKAQSLIIQGVSDKHLDIIKDCKSAKEQLKCLKDVLVRTSSFTKLTLWRKLFNLKSANNELLEDHFVKFDTIIRDLQDLGSQIDESDRVCHLLLSLPSQYDTVITAIETVADVKMDFVKARLLDEEIKIRTRHDNNCTSENSEVSFKAFTTGSGCYICGDKSHFKAQCPKKFARGYRGYRGRRGHGRFNRFHRGIPNKGALANLAKDEDNIVLFAANFCNQKNTFPNNAFVIDSGASNHFIKEELLPYMNNVVKMEHEINIHIADGELLKSTMKGELNTKCQGFKIKIEALVVPKLKHNLLSASKIASRGSKVIIQENETIINTGRSVLTCEKVNGVYLLIVDDFAKENCNVGIEDGDLWHNRMGHPGKDALSQLGLPVPGKVCTTCIESKATRLPFIANKKQSVKIGDLIHSDVCGPVTPSTINGERYFQVILDDFSHFVVIKLLKHKNEAAQNLISYIRELETQFEVRAKRLRLDNGGEFKSKLLLDFAEKKGIRIEYTISHSPQMNGKSERMNRTLLNKIRSKLIDSNIPKCLWGEALKCSVYELNRSPTATLKRGKTPASLWHGRNDLSKMKIFGCRAWHTVAPKDYKLNPRAVRAVMVGYCGGGYRLWLPKEEKVIRSRDVRFDESIIEYRSEAWNTVSNYNTESTESSKIVAPIASVSDRSVESDSENSKNESVTDNRTRPTRKIRPPTHLEDYELYSAYCLLAATLDEPKSYDEAVKSDEWSKAIRHELESHEKLKTWTPAALPIGQKAIDTRWIFKSKADGTKKARLVARGFQEPMEPGGEFAYSPVCRMQTIRMLLSQAINKDWPIKQIDVPTAFLHGNLDHDVYIKTPKGLNCTERFLKLNKALYGLRKSPKCWNDCFSEVMKKLKLRRSEYDFCLFVSENMYLVVFVDDVIITGDLQKVDAVIEELVREFKVKKLGNVSSFLGMQIERDNNEITVTQPRIIEKLLRDYGMDICRSIATPMEVGFSNEKLPVNDKVPYRNLVCSLMYLAVTSRPDISFSTSYLSRYLDRPTDQTWKAAKRILRYLHATRNLGLRFTKGPQKLEGYADADWAADHETRKSVSGFVAFHANNPISWFSKKQSCVALSTMEAEYLSGSAAAQELVNLKGLMSEFKCESQSAILKIDNLSAISMIKTCENSKRGKHIDIRYHFIKDLFNKKIIDIEYVNTNLNIADMFTKPLCKEKFVLFRNLAMNVPS